MSKTPLVIFGVLTPLLLVHNVRAYNNSKCEVEYIDCFEIEGRIYRFNERLKKKDYERLRDKFCGDRPFKQCDKYYALEDYVIDKHTLQVKKSMFYSEYHGVC